MTVICNKQYKNKSMPSKGTQVECFDIQQAFGETFYLCIWHGLLLSIKKQEIKEEQAISYTERNDGQFAIDFN